MIMNDSTNELAQWLLDFADANNGYFDSDQIEKLIEAAEAIKILDEAVNILIVERDDSMKVIDSLLIDCAGNTKVDNGKNE
jgi:hypothetical protein